jgi:hypothetical protein
MVITDAEQLESVGVTLLHLPKHFVGVLLATVQQASCTRSADATGI